VTQASVHRYFIFRVTYVAVTIAKPRGNDAERPASSYSYRRNGRNSMADVNFQALFYEVLPSTTAVLIVTPLGPENCRLTNKTRRVIYSCQQSLHQHK